MNQQDYLERQIEMLGKVLASIMAKLSDAENIYLPFFITQEFTVQEREMLDVDNWPPKSHEEAEKFLDNPHWTPQLTEQMLELLLIVADKSTEEEKSRILESIDFCLDVLNEKSDYVSFNRLSIMERAQALNSDENGI